MFQLRTYPTILLSAVLIITPAFASRTHRAPTSGHHVKHPRRAAKKHEIKGQRQIDPARATEIQTALIKDHYLTGQPTGQWDAQSEAAMQKFQADNGWQTRLTPDSRALIKLGLGPERDAGSLRTASESKTAPAPPPSTAGDSTLASVHSISN